MDAAKLSTEISNLSFASSAAYHSINACLRWTVLFCIIL